VLDCTDHVAPQVMPTAVHTCFLCAYAPIKARSLYITGSRVLPRVQYNKLIYAEDILVLNEANRDTSPIVSGVPRLYGIAKRAGRLCGEC
jgi:hypothetical protein